MGIINEDNYVGRGYGGFSGGEGGLGIVALLALLGGRGLGGDRGRDCEPARDCVTNATLEASLGSLQTSLGNAAILGKLASIEAAVPAAEAQVQLALSGVESTLVAQANTNVMSVIQGQHAAALHSCESFAGVARDIAAVDTNVDRQSTAIQVAIRDDGERTRALIVANQIAELNQRLTVAQLENVECRSINREQTNSHNQTVTINTLHNQQQLQFQEQRNDVATLRGLLFETLQNIRSTNSAINIGGTQLASPTNTNSNVKA